MAAKKVHKDLTDSTLDWLEESFPGFVRREEPLRNRTTFRCGACAKGVVSPPDAEVLSRVVAELTKRGVEWQVLGRGSNLLVRDGGYRGVLVDLSEGFMKIALQGRTDDQVFVRAEAGVPNGLLLSWLRDRRIRGFGFSFGIPGSIGGGIRMNAGTPLGWFGRVVREVETVRKTGEPIRLRVTEADFAYRDFPKGRDLVITAGLFLFYPSEPDRVESEIDAAKKQRTQQPLELPNFGSVFKNPGRDFAGHLIEQAGLKGRRIGDAQISPKHANFIVNLGNATTRDALKLMEQAQAEVSKKFGVELEPEVHVIGVDA
ncbi:MAG: UDP-N-acetylmuramate dehydrogenase [Pseudomonadota bacterium]